MPLDLEKSIFLSALDCETPSERAAYLDKACGGDRSLRQSVEKLLAAYEQSENILGDDEGARSRLQQQLADAAAVLDPEGHGPQPDVAATIIAAPGRQNEVIRNFRLLELLGEGGFGQVYVAEQLHPVRRRVAVKLLKPGMDSREVVARFEAERQALALMDHPNIAAVFDAGTTDAGRPYIVMELVRGVPITAFCDQRRLTVTQRLGLFLSVCEAVQHAHQKGVIHRDIKPSNILVTLHDATPVAKVIDFGVAKALGEPLTDKTIYTRFAQMIGTPMYMSPEQAEMNALDVDTRSDIYSLGVLLYELLTGTTPFDQRRLCTASFDELRRIIREEEPPRPSQRATTLGAAETTGAARTTAPLLVSADLRNDLDWIVMKSLEKDRRRRYETASDLARDVRRALDQQPVIARPPSPWYRFSKFARRNRVLLSSASLVLLALLAGTVVSIGLAVDATKARKDADAARRKAEQFADRLKEANVLLDSARANADEQRWSLAYDEYSRATELSPDHYLTWSGRGQLQARRGAFHAAAADFVKAVDLGAPANNPAWWGVPQLLLYAGEREAYESICTRMRTQLADSEDMVFAGGAIRSFCLQPMAPDEARRLARRAEDIHAAAIGFEKQFPFGAPGTGRDGGPPPNGPPPNGRPNDGPPRDGPPPEGSPPGPPPGPPPGTAFERVLAALLQAAPSREPRRKGPPPEDSAGVLDRGAGRERPDISRIMRPFRVPRTLTAYLAGLAQLRAGESSRAIELLTSVVRERDNFAMGDIAWPALALAQHAAGRADEARESLAESNRVLEARIAEMQVDPSEKAPLAWFDFPEHVLLHREAVLTITGVSLPDDPRLEAIERRALEMLQQGE